MIWKMCQECEALWLYKFKSCQNLYWSETSSWNIPVLLWHYDSAISHDITYTIARTTKPVSILGMGSANQRRYYNVLLTDPTSHFNGFTMGCLLQVSCRKLAVLHWNLTVSQNSKQETKLCLPISSSAASMTAAPFNMVAMRMSWPGQSTKETWRTSLNLAPSTVVTSHGNSSAWELPREV